jgi:thiamine-monophosphate kinase
VDCTPFSEFSFIDFIKSQAKNGWIKDSLGIGDDCAIIPYTDTLDLLVSTDAFVQDVHFLLDKASALDIGFKAAAVNLSDIAAMGGDPLALFLTLSFPKNTEKKWLDEFIKGILSFNVPLMGGDTTASKEGIFISLTVLGTIKKGGSKLRRSGKAGDIICTTATLGNSGLGFEHLKENISSPFIVHHLRPTPHLKEGKFLAQFTETHAMMDLSDGLAIDLFHICQESKVSAQIDLDNLPIEQGLKGKKHPFSYALESGEDYCLLATIDKQAFNEINIQFEKEFNHPLYQVGHLIEGSGTVEYFLNGKKHPVQYRGFDHFSY